MKVKQLFEAWRSFVGEAKESSLYGGNFAYRLKQYITPAIDDNDSPQLPQYGVHYSDYPKWGLNPETSYFPPGVYFYFLSSACLYGTGKVFAADRRYANIGKLDLDKFAICYKEHPRHFTEQNLEDAVNILGYGFDENHGIELQRYESATPLGKLLFIIGTNNKASATPKELKRAGYSGILDIDGEVLTVEGCQGVQTYPDGVRLVESILASASKARYPSERKENILKFLKNSNNGSLQFNYDELSLVWKNLPQKWNDDIALDYLGWLARKLDFSYENAWSWFEQEYERFPDVLWHDLQFNPTAPELEEPKERWESI